jgi:ribosomal protein L44E
MKLKKRSPKKVMLYCDFCEKQTPHELDVDVVDDALASQRRCLECQPKDEMKQAAN